MWCETFKENIVINDVNDQVGQEKRLGPNQPHDVEGIKGNVSVYPNLQLYTYFIVFHHYIKKN